MSHYIIGIDGGGTKTLGVLFDLDGNEIKRSIAGFANFSVDETKTINNIKSVLNELTKDIKGTIDQTIIGIAGYTNYLGKDKLVNELKELYQTPIKMVTDAEIALYSVKQDKDLDVILILGGTGSVIIVGKNEEIEYIGGYGHILGDKGSAYHLSITLLQDIIQRKEEQKEITLLQGQVLSEIHSKGFKGIKEFVYNSSKSEIATLSMLAAYYAERGEKDAIELFKKEAYHLAEQTKNAYQLLDHDTVIIGLKGGFLLNAPFVKESLIEELKKSSISYQLNDEETEPVKGAYYLAKRTLRRGDRYGRH